MVIDLAKMTLKDKTELVIRRLYSMIIEKTIGKTVGVAQRNIYPINSKN